MTWRITTGLALLGALLGWGADSAAQTVKHYRFSYDQPKNTGYGIVGDIFANKLAELSKNTMLIEQYPGAQLGQEPQVLQLVKSGDIDFCISSSANAATLSVRATSDNSVRQRVHCATWRSTTSRSGDSRAPLVSAGSQ